MRLGNTDEQNGVTLGVTGPAQQHSAAGVSNFLPGELVEPRAIRERLGFTCKTRRQPEIHKAILMRRKVLAGCNTQGRAENVFTSKEMFCGFGIVSPHVGAYTHLSTPSQNTILPSPISHKLRHVSSFEVV